jgi:hypothetical protein
MSVNTSDRGTNEVKVNKRKEKITMTNINIIEVDGQRFPLATKQPTRYHTAFTGKDWAVALTPDLLKDKHTLWKTKGYAILNELAKTRAAQTGRTLQQSIHSCLWWCLFNQPRSIVLYVPKVDEDVKGVITFAISHGVTVKLEDIYSGIKEIYRPVANLFKHKLFKLCKVEELYKKIEPLKEEERPEIADRVFSKYAHLIRAREAYLQEHLQPKINEVLKNLIRWYEVDEAESIYQKVVYAQRYAAEDTIAEYRDLEEYDLPRNVRGFNEHYVAELAKRLQIWAPAFDIPIKLDATEPTFYLSKTHAGTTAYTMRKSQISKLQAQVAPVHELIRAYVQIRYYLRHGAEDFLSDKYYLCSCKHPVPKSAECCPYCGATNENLWEESPSPNMEYLAY